jgi:pSer/pThr/pTyr-binding forkhead associated (FHA) protein
MNGARPPAERDGPARAAERRRGQGRAPAPAGPPDTRTSLPEKHRDPRVTGDRQRPATTAKAVDQVSVEGGVSGAIACVRGPEAGLTLSLAPGTYTIGRARENDLVLKDIAASRKHLRIDVDGRVARLVDLGSGNGTKVNGKRASECELRHGDVIEIGASALVYSEPGRTATVDREAKRDEAQARVVAAADELARELSQKLRFGDNVDPAFDGHGARTRAIRIADARAARDEVHREAPTAPVPGKKAPDRLWNETFTNVPLSAVVADDQRLQGTGTHREREPRRPPPPAPFPMAPPTPAPTPVGTAAAGADDDAVVKELSRGQQRSFLTSVLLSAGVVVLLGTLAWGASTLLQKPPAADDKTAEYVAAITRAQDAITRQDWASVREYTVVALQVKPDDPLALTYKTEADNKLAAAALAAAPTPAPTPPVEPPTAPPVAAPQPAADPPPPPPVVAPVGAPPAPVAAPPPPSARPRPAPPPSPKPRVSSKRTLSDDEARARFERAIDAFRSKDNDTGCKLLSQIANQAAADSAWRGKADSLFLKRCGG